VAADATYLADAIKNPSYSRALTELLAKSRTLPSWTLQVLKTSGNYVGSPVVSSTVDGAKYALFHTCKAHDCSENQMELMFSPNGAQAWGAVMESGKSISYLGAPGPAQRSALKTGLQH
jgi:hypothetical protein